MSVSTVPVTRHEIVHEHVTKEAVTIHREPVEAEIEAVPPIRQDGDLTIIPVVEERLVLVRKLVLVEEIRVRKTRTSKLVEEAVELRGTDVIIDD